MTNVLQQVLAAEGIVTTVLSLASYASTYNVAGHSFSQTNGASGGTTPYTYSISSGSVPSGTSINSATGTVSGTPSAGGFSYTVKVSDSGSQVATSVVSGTITAALSLYSPASSTLTAGESYSQSNTASGGTGGNTYSISGGSVPSGTSINSSTGTVSGTPSAGAFGYDVTVTDSGGQTSTNYVSGTITAALSLYSPVSGTTAARQTYAQGNTASGGSGSYTYSITGGSVPAGTTLNSSNGTVSGTPTTAGGFGYDVTVTDSSSNTATNYVSGTISAVVPGSVTYESGSGNFTIPPFNSLAIQLWGGGGGGGGFTAPGTFVAGSNGASSTAYGITAGPGIAGSAGASTTGGAGGSAAGENYSSAAGTAGTIGGSAGGDGAGGAGGDGGAGGAGLAYGTISSGHPGSAPGGGGGGGASTFTVEESSGWDAGGGGGGGGFAQCDFAAGSLAVGGTISWVVGAGGAGGAGATAAGGAGAAGYVAFTWD
jgi:hypothetical protein